MAAQDSGPPPGLGQASGSVSKAHSVLSHLCQLLTHALPFIHTRFLNAAPVLVTLSPHYSVLLSIPLSESPFCPNSPPLFHFKDLSEANFFPGTSLG